MNAVKAEPKRTNACLTPKHAFCQAQGHSSVAGIAGIAPFGYSRVEYLAA